MKWPWVSRRAYDLAIQRVADLEDQLGQLVQQIVRIGRKSVGLPEATHEPRPQEPMPAAVRDLFEQQYGLANEATRSTQLRGIWQIYKSTGSWDVVLERMREPEMEEEEVGG